MHDAHGIIPARAGFTHFQSSFRFMRADHPRSRGVYVMAMMRRVTAMGSSPLARGLREWRGGAGYRYRIIPARAGFTGLQ